jgi:hypothetical protein
MLGLTQKIIIYILLLIAIYIFVKTSKIEILGKKLIKLRYLVILAIFFPVVLLLALILSSFLAAAVLIVVFLFFFYSFLKKKKLI